MAVPLYGLDLTAAMGVAYNGEDKHIEEPWIPSVALPMVQDEMVITGPAGARHRRGLGFAWPPESQTHYAGDPQLGMPRHLLAEAWQQLVPYCDDILSWDPYIAGNRCIEWQPEIGGTPISLPVEEVIAQTASEICGEASESGVLALVVPDDIGEGAQEALLGALRSHTNHRVHLVPRPAAVAIHWCSLQDPNSYTAEEGKCGHIIVLSTAMDRWDIAALEIKKVDNGRVKRLIPVRDHTYQISAIEVSSIELLLAIRASMSNHTSDGFWTDLVGGDLAQWVQKHDLQIDSDLLAKHMPQARNLLRSWGMQTTANLTIDAITNEIGRRMAGFAKRHHDSTLLATVVDGHLAAFPAGQARFGAAMVGRHSKNVTVMTGHAAARGAATIAQQLHAGEHTYEDRIASIGTWVMSQNEFYDPCIRLDEIVPSTTVMAGKVFRSPEPLGGFTIRKCSDSLNIILARELGCRDLTRSVESNPRRPTTRDEPVLITGEVRPGQGFATIRIESERPGVYSSTINWQTMRDGRKPDEPQYAWPPGMARISEDKGRLDAVRCNLEEALSELKKDRLKTFPFVDCAREQINKYARSPSWAPTKSELFHYYGPFASSETLEKSSIRRLLDQLRERLEHHLHRRPGHDVLLRFSTWLYEACPAMAITQTRGAFEGDEEKEVHLGLAGQSFTDVEDIGLFMDQLQDAINRKLRQGRRSTNSGSSVVNNNWLRALRNLLRFRVEAVGDAMDPRAAQTIAQYLIREMGDQQRQHNLANIYSNCLESFIHLLKRRKFDEDFLAPDSALGKDAISTIDYAMEHGSAKQRKLAKATMRFLQRRGTMEDADILWRNESD